MKKRTATVFSQRRQRGFSLVEIMIALVLGVLLMAAAGQVFYINKRTHQVLEAQSRLQENGCYALDLLTKSIREAGYLGCASKSINIANTLNTSTDYLYNMAAGLQGAEWVSASSWTPALDASIASPASGGDVITIRGRTGTVLKLQAAMSAHYGSLLVPANNTLQTCDTVMVADCSAVSVLQLSAIHVDGTLDHAVGGACVPGNATTDLGKVYQSDAEVSLVATTSYYLRASSNAQFSGQLSLWRRINANAAEEMVEGVQDMQIRYGEDTDADGSPNRYVTADLVANWANVVSVRTSLLVSTTAINLTVVNQTVSFNGATQTAANGRLMRAFSATVGIRNRLP